MHACTYHLKSGMWSTNCPTLGSEGQINGLQLWADLAGLILFMATTAVTFLVRAVTWTHVDVGQATGLAVSSAAVVVFILLCLVPDVGRDR